MSLFAIPNLIGAHLGGWRHRDAYGPVVMDLQKTIELAQLAERGKLDGLFLADGNADFTKAIGMELDASGNGLGIRSKRYSMLVDDGVVKKLNLEPAPGKVEVSGGDTLLGQL